jgi:hypothetical protein
LNGGMVFGIVMALPVPHPEKWMAGHLAALDPA